MDWGTERGLRSLFGRHMRDLMVSPRTFVFRARSPEHFLELMQIYRVSALSARRPSDHVDDDAALRALTRTVGRLKPGEDGSMIVPSNYLEVVASKR